MANGNNYEFGSCARITVCSNQGGRKYMEDRVNVHCQRKPNGDLDYIFLGIYDGHGGSDASQYAKEHLRFAITEQKCFHSDDDESVLRAIKDGFLQTHYEMWKTFENWPKTASGYPSTSGTTASIAIIKKGKVYFGHVGDSGIVLGKKFADSSVDGSMITVDHKPDHPDEMKRIEEMGGEVMNKSGVMRVVWTRTTRGHQGPVRRSTSIEKVPFLAVARALGDLWSYNSALDVFVVSPEPDVGVLKLEYDDVCILLGSDGLWNVIKAQNSVEIVNSHEWRELQDKSSNLQVMQSNHARWMARHALLRWGNLRADNISVISVLLDPPHTCNEKMVGVVVENPQLDIESMLTEYPTALIRVTPRQTQVAKTKPVELVYFGTSDPSDKMVAMTIYGARNGLTSWTYQHRNTAISYRGPGYNSYGDDRSENWSILTSIVDKFLLKPSANRCIPDTFISTTEAKTNWDKKGFDADDENQMSPVKKEKTSNSRIMLMNNKPNLPSSPPKTSVPFVSTNANNIETNLHIIMTTPKRRCIGGDPSSPIEAANSFHVEKSSPTTTVVDSKRSQLTTPTMPFRKRRSNISSPITPVTCGYYNLRRCSRITRSGAKLSPPSSSSKSLPGGVATAVVRHRSDRQRRHKYRRFSLITATVNVDGGLSRTRRLTDSVRKNVFFAVDQQKREKVNSFPYGLRERPQSSLDKLKLATATNLTEASLVMNELITTLKTPSMNKTRKSAIVVASSSSSSSSLQVSSQSKKRLNHDDSLSVSFAKRLKIFVDAGLTRFRRENN